MAEALNSVCHSLERIHCVKLGMVIEIVAAIENNNFGLFRNRKKIKKKKNDKLELWLVFVPWYRLFAFKQFKCFTTNNSHVLRCSKNKESVKISFSHVVSSKRKHFPFE